MPHRYGDVGAERLVERVDQRRIGQNAGDIFGGDDAHVRLLLPISHSLTGERSAEAAAPGRRGARRSGRSAMSRRRRNVAFSAKIRGFRFGAPRRAAPFALPQPGGDAADR